MLTGNKIIKKIDTKEFLDKIKEYSANQIECTTHTFFRLNEKQRQTFTCEKLKEFLIHEEPFLVGLQKNNNYAVFYKYKENKFIRIIIDIDIRKINIVTFYFIFQQQIPRI